MDKARRKELGYNYAHSHRPMGVYRIVNTGNEKMYIGSSLNLDGVWNKHKFMLDIKAHDNKELQSDWNECGEAGFRFEVLEQIKPEEDFVADVQELKKYSKRLPDMESKWLEQLSPYGERGYHKQK